MPVPVFVLVCGYMRVHTQAVTHGEVGARMRVVMRARARVIMRLMLGLIIHLVKVVVR